MRTSAAVSGARVLKTFGCMGDIIPCVASANLLAPTIPLRVRVQVATIYGVAVDRITTLGLGGNPIPHPLVKHTLFPPPQR